MLKKLIHNLKTFQQQSAIITAEALAGENVFCVCCDKSFITFLPFGVVKRANALCPNCHSLERHRMHYHYMFHQTNLLNGQSLKMLHVAPEIILYNKFIANNAIDYVPCAKFGPGFSDQYDYPPKTVDVDITEICFIDNEFDVIYCSHVLEHIPNDRKAMEEFYRVLKPGGWSLLQVPLDINLDKTYEDFSIINTAERKKAFGQWDHVRVYGKDYKDRLTEAGFEVRVERYKDSFSENDLFKYGFMKDEDIYLCKKH